MLDRLLKKFIRAREGVTAIEYAFIAGGIGIAIFAAVGLLGVSISDWFARLGAWFDSN